MLRRAHRWVGRVGNGLGRLLDLLCSLLGDGPLGDGRLLGDCLRGGGHLGDGGLDGRLLGGELLGDDGLLGGGLLGGDLLLHNDVVLDAERLGEGECARVRRGRRDDDDPGVQTRTSAMMRREGGDDHARMREAQASDSLAMATRPAKIRLICLRRFFFLHDFDTSSSTSMCRLSGGLETVLAGAGFSISLAASSATASSATGAAAADTADLMAASSVANSSATTASSEAAS